MNLMIGILSAAVLPVLNKQNESVSRWLCGVEIAWTCVILLYYLSFLSEIWDGSGGLFAPVCMLLLGVWGISRGGNGTASVGAVLVLIVLPLFAGIGVAAAEDVNWKWAIRDGLGFDSSVITACLLPGVSWQLPDERKTKKWYLIIPAAGAAFCLVIRGFVPDLLSDMIGIGEVGRSVELFGRIVRLEAVVAMALTLSLYALLSMLLTAVSWCAARIAPIRKKWILAIAVISITMGMLCKITISDEIVAIGSIICWVIIPLATQVIGSGKK